MKKPKKIVLTLSQEDRTWLEELLRQLVGEKKPEGFREKIRKKVVKNG